MTKWSDGITAHHSHFQADIILCAVRWYLQIPPDLVVNL
jgi:hypothetical protein